jgi:DNA-binding transcriptional regulator GbsR (MarR family)
MSVPLKAQSPAAIIADGSASGLVLGEGRGAGVIAFENQVVDFFVSAAELLGVPKSVAAIYGVLFASPLPLSFAAISARLDLSRGSISQGLRALREIGAIKEVSTPADRAELFTPDTEMRRLIAHFLESRVQQQLDSGKKRLAAFEPPLETYSSAEQRILKQRLAKLQRWHDRTRKLLPVIRTFLKLSS